MKTTNPIRKTLTRLAVASTMGAAMFFGASPASAAPPVTSGLKLHLDASALTGLSDGETVTTWTDVSGSGNNATAIGSAATYQTGALNGQPVVRFNGDGYSRFNFTRISTIRTVFWVVKTNNSGENFMLGDTDAYDFHPGDDNKIWGYWTNDNVKGGTTKLNGAVVNGESTVLPSGSYSLLSLATTGNVQADSLSADRNNAYGGRSWKGDMAEVLIYDRALTVVEEESVGTYLAAKYGLSTTYPPAGPPAAVTGLTAIPLHLGVRLDWTASPEFGIAGYHVYRGSATGTYDLTPIGTTTTATTYNDMTAVSGGPYYYVVKATNSAGPGAASNEASASPSAVPVDQTITFALGLAVTKTAADAPFPDTASAFPSGLPVTYSSDNATVATVDASTGEVTLTGVPGTAHILANQPGNANFNAAPQVSQTLTVTQAMPVITWTPAPIMVNTALGSTQLNASSGGVDGTFVYTPPSGTLMNVAGPQNLSVQFTPTDTVKYSTPALQTVVLLVAPVETTVIWDTGDGTWNTTVPIWKGNDSGYSTFFTQGNHAIFNSSAGGAITIESGMEPASTTVSATSGTYTFSGGPLAGTGTLTKSVGGTLSINGTHTYTGGTVINGGWVSVGGNAIAGTGPITVDGGNFQVNGGTLPNAIIINSGFVDVRWYYSVWDGQVTLNAPDSVLIIPYNLTVNGTISGTGKLHALQANAGDTNGLTLNGNNTYSGGTVFDNSSLILGHANALGTGPVWLTTGWPFNPVSIAAAVDLSGGTGVQNNIVLETNATIYANNNIKLSGVISGTGNLTKAGNSNLVLTGTNTYTGATIVTSGTLQCDNPNALGGGALSISTGGAKVNLNYTGTKGVASLTLGGEAKTANGTYGSVLSGATFQDDTYFAGTGMVRVGGSPYDAWANGTFANGATLTDKDPTHDPDGDGQTNQQEFAFGLDPTTGASVNPITQQLAGGVFKYTRAKDSGLTYKVYYSTNLTGWTWDEFASQMPAAAVLGVETVTVTLAAAAPLDGKLFVRVEASP